MKRGSNWIFGILVFELTVLALTAVVGATTGAPGPSVPLAFLQNAGQFADEVLYRAEAQGVAIWITRSGATYQFLKVDRLPATTDGNIEMQKSGLPSVAELTYQSQVLSIRFNGADLSHIRPGQAVGDYVNYFVGADRSKWISGVPVAASVLFESVYPQIDLKYYGNGRALEFDLIVLPGGDPADISIQVAGASDIAVTPNGELTIRTPFGEAIHKQPFVYQERGGRRAAIACSYQRTSDNTLGFKILEDYDTDLPLIIDPEITFATYLGGSTYDEGWGVTVDDKGYIYTTGLTASTDFPTIPAEPPVAFPVNIFVSKISPDGTALIYSTYIGGNNYDGATNIAVDADGNAYLTGETKSTDFPLVAPVQNLPGGGSDAFVVKLSSDGGTLAYSSYLGGTNFELGRAIAVNSQGEACVVGHTCSDDFPMVNAYQEGYGGESTSIGHCGDVFVAKIGATGDVLQFSTYLGGTGYDEGWGVAVDGDDNVYAVGLTASTDFPVQSAAFPAAVLADAFVTKLTADGKELVYSTYLGGDDYDGATSVAVDRFGRAAVTGETKSSDFPHINAAQALPGGMSDAFVAKFESTGAAVVYSTNIGGSGSELGWDITVDAFGGATIAGRTASDDYPLQSELKSEITGYYDAIVTRVAPGGHVLTFSSYFGGSLEEDARSVAVHKGTSVLIAGTTISEDLPTINAFQETYGGGWGIFPRGDAYVASLFVTYACGDLDGSGTVGISDIVILLNFIFAGGPSPLDANGGDINCDGRPTISDAVYLVNYVFSGGPAPCATCE